MNPGPELGLIAVAASYAVVLVSIVVFLGMVAGRQKRLEKRRRELQQPAER